MLKTGKCETILLDLLRTEINTFVKNFEAKVIGLS